MKKILMLWAVLGAIYVTIETLWRGYSHPSMFIVGGLCGVLVGCINQFPKFYRAPVIIQSIIGAFIVLTVEFISGLILNIWLGLDVWDYSDLFGNIMGQVCILFAFAWLLLMPFAIWAEDTTRWLIYLWNKSLDRLAEPQPVIPPYTLSSIYIDFFTGK